MQINRPAPFQWEAGNPSAESNWTRLACDVTHYHRDRYLTLLDSGASRFCEWEPLLNESTLTVVDALLCVSRGMGPLKELLLNNFSTFKERLVRVCVTIGKCVYFILSSGRRLCAFERFLHRGELRSLTTCFVGSCVGLACDFIETPSVLSLTFSQIPALSSTHMPSTQHNFRQLGHQGRFCMICSAHSMCRHATKLMQLFFKKIA